MRRRAGNAVDHPGLGVGDLHANLDAGPDLAGCAAQVVTEPCNHQRRRLEIAARRCQLIERYRPVAAGAGGMGVFGLNFTFTGLARDDFRVITELGAAGDDVDGADVSGSAASGAQYFERQLRHAVAELRHIQSFKHHVSNAAIGRRVRSTLLGDDQAVGILGPGAGIDTHRQSGDVEVLAIGPHPADAVDLAFAERHGKVGKVSVFGDLGCSAAALGTAAFRPRAGDFLEIGGPDHLARHAHAAPQPGDRRCLGGRHHPQVGQPRPFGLALTAEQRLVDDVSGNRTGRPADDAADGSAEECANALSSGLQYNCGHQPVTPGKRNAKARWRSHQGDSAISTTSACSCAWIIVTFELAIPACLAGR